MKIIEYNKEYDEQIKDLLVELQEYLVKIDDWSTQILYEDYKEKYFKIDMDKVEKQEGKIYLAKEDKIINGLIIGAVEPRNEMYKITNDCAKSTQSYIGKTVSVIVDRQMGSKHPKHRFTYPINYGYVPNTISGDGENLDCYILGVFEPIESFTGKCIAIIHRLNDNDDKLVLVPEDKKYTNDEIRVLTEFQERFFESVIIN